MADAPAAPTAAPAQKPGGPQPSPGQIAFLRQNPDKAADFDANFGSGSAEFFLTDEADIDLTPAAQPGAQAQPAKDPSFLQNVGEILPSIGRGALKAVDATSQLVADGLRAGVEAAGGDPTVIADPIKYADFAYEPESVTGQVTVGLSQAIVGFAGAGKLGFLKNLSKYGKGVQYAAQGAVGDFVVFDEHEMKLSNVIEDQFPALKGSWATALAADEDDSVVLGRLKGAAEGVIIGATAAKVIDGMLWTVKAIRAARRGDMEAASRALDNANEAARGGDVDPAVPPAAPVAPAPAAPKVEPVPAAPKTEAPNAPPAAPQPTPAPAAAAPASTPAPEVPPLRTGEEIGLSPEDLKAITDMAQAGASDVRAVPFRADKFLGSEQSALSLMGAVAKHFEDSATFSVKETAEKAAELAKDLGRSREGLLADLSFGVRNDNSLAAQVQARLFVFAQAGKEADEALQRYASMAPGPEKEAAFNLYAQAAQRLVTARQAAGAPLSQVGRALRQAQENRVPAAPSAGTKQAQADFEGTLRRDEAAAKENAPPEVKAELDEADEVIRELDEVLPTAPKEEAPVAPKAEGEAPAAPKAEAPAAPKKGNTEALQSPKARSSALKARIEKLRAKIDELHTDIREGTAEAPSGAKKAGPKDATEAVLSDSVQVLRDFLRERLAVIAREADEGVDAAADTAEAAAKRAEALEQKWSDLVADFSIGAAERAAARLEARAAKKAGDADVPPPPEEISRLIRLIKEEDKAFAAEFRASVPGPGRKELARGNAKAQAAADKAVRDAAPGPGREQLARAEAAKARLEEAKRRLALGSVGRQAEDAHRAANPKYKAPTSAEAKAVLDQQRAQDAALRAELQANRAAGKEETLVADAVAKLNRKDVDKLMDILKGTTDPVIRRRVMAEFVAKPATIDVALRAYKNLLLTGLGTHLLSPASNVLQLNSLLVREVVAGKAAGDTARIVAAQRGFYEQFTQMGDALRAAKGTFITGRSHLGGPSSVQEGLKDPRGRLKNLGHIMEGANEQNIAKVGWYAMKELATDFALRGLSAGDEFVKMMAYSARVRGQAYAEGMTNGLSGDRLSAYIDDAWTRARDVQTGEALNEGALNFARESTFTAAFRKDTFFGQAGSALSGVTARADMFGRTASILLPFVGTPARVLDNFWQTSVFNPALYRELTHADQAIRSNAIARFATGAFFTTMAGGLVASGNMTGGGPSDPGLNAVWRQEHRPYSIRNPFNGEWVSISRLDPGATHLGIIADLMELAATTSHTTDQDLAIKTASAMLARQFKNKLFFSSLAGFFAGMQDSSGSAGSRFAAGQLSVVVPPGLSQFNTDPYIREARSVVERIRARTPWGSRGLDAARDPLGRALLAPSGSGWLPVTSYAPKKDPVGRVLVDVYQKAGKTLERASPVRDGVDLREVVRPSEELKRDQSAYDRLQQLSQQLGVEQGLRDLFESKMFADASDELRVEMTQARISEYRDRAYAQVLKEYGPLLEPLQREALARRKSGERNDFSALLRETQ